MHIFLRLRMTNFQRLGCKRSHNHSHVQEMRCAHAGLGESRCLAGVACFLKHDPAEARLCPRESEWSPFDNGSEQLGRYLCQKVLALEQVQLEVATSENVSQGRHVANQEALPNRGCVFATVQFPNYDALSACLADDLNEGRQPAGHLCAVGAFQ